MYSMVVLAYVMCIFLAGTLLQTAPFDSIYAITGTRPPADPEPSTHAQHNGKRDGTGATDEHANVVENLGSHTFKNDDRVPDLMDIPISVVNRCVFAPGVEDDVVVSRSGRLKRPWPSQPNLAALPSRLSGGAVAADG